MTPKKSRQAAGAPSTLRSDVSFTCAPFGAPEGVARELVGALPTDTAALMKRLSEEKWDEHDRTSNSPELTAEGHVNVHKVYFYDGTDRNSFNSPTGFNDFVNYVDLLVSGTTVHLLLWDKRTTSARDKGEMNGLCVFSVLVVNAFRWERAAGRMLPLQLQRLDSAGLCFPTGNSHACPCFHGRSPNPLMPTGLCLTSSFPGWQAKAEEEEEEEEEQQLLLGR